MKTCRCTRENLETISFDRLAAELITYLLWVVLVFYSLDFLIHQTQVEEALHYMKSVDRQVGPVSCTVLVTTGSLGWI